jgi:hypothetical protein
MSASSNIAIEVTAGESAPNGFVIEWMTVAGFIANGNQWPDNPDEVCQGSFPNSLAPNQTMDVVVGDDRLFDSFGVRGDCSGDPLLCDTAYVFRCRVNETESCDADGAERQILQGPKVGMVFPVALRIRAILSRIARQRRAGNGITPRDCRRRKYSL